MRILLTGSSGFLGKYFGELLQFENNIVSLNRNIGDYKCDLKYQMPNFDTPFDLVIHNASKVHSIPRNIFEKNDFFDVNVKGTLNLLRGLKNVGCPKMFVFISSVSVYGLIKGENIDEDTPLNANDPYGRSKIEAEEVIKKWCSENSVICTILRLPLVAGSNPPGNLGLMIKGIKNGFYFNVAGGKSNKSIVLAIDIAKFVVKASKVGGVYNLTDGYHPNFYELSRTIGLQLGKNFIPNLSIFIAKILAYVGDFLGEKFPFNTVKLDKITSTLTFDDSKARKAFGWDPSSVIDEFQI
jgi:nucleoside-diphosphate-sugar epimerase